MGAMVGIFSTIFLLFRYVFWAWKFHMLATYSLPVFLHRSQKKSECY